MPLAIKHNRFDPISSLSYHHRVDMHCLHHKASIQTWHLLWMFFTTRKFKNFKISIEFSYRRKSCIVLLLLSRHTFGYIKSLQPAIFWIFPVKILICCPRDPACQPLFPLYCWTQVKYSLLYILGRFHSHILTYLTRLISFNLPGVFLWL